MTTVAYKLSLATILSVIITLIALLSSAQSVHAESVQWNGLEPSTIYDPSNDPGFNSQFGTSNFSSIGSQNVTITYNARVTNADTGAVVQCGSAVPSGTKLKFEFVPHVYTDISWFTTGFAFDSPYGDWVTGAAKPYPDMCSSKADKDFIGTYTWRLGTVNDYVALAVDPPAKTTSISSLFSCSGSSSDQSRVCTATGNGTASNSFNFAATTGRYYARIYFDRAGYAQLNEALRRFKNPSGGSSGYATSQCYASNGPMYKSSAAYILNVPAQSISCPIIVGSGGGTPPTTPSISSGGACTVGTAFNLSFASTDPNGRQLKYGVDWDNDGAIDQLIPPSGYVNPGTTQSASRTYSTGGQKTVRVVALNDQGAQSAWATHTFTCAGLSCPIGYIWDGTQCVSSCPSGYRWDGTTCVLSGQCATPARCSGNDLVNSCTGTIIQSCAFGCASGACVAAPALSATLNATPSLLHMGNITTVSWSSANAASCAVSGTNGDSWSGISSGTVGRTSSPIQAQTIYTLHCIGITGSNPPTVDKTATVNIIPTFIEK